MAKLQNNAICRIINKLELANKYQFIYPIIFFRSEWPCCCRPSGIIRRLEGKICMSKSVSQTTKVPEVSPSTRGEIFDRFKFYTKWWKSHYIQMSWGLRLRFQPSTVVLWRNFDQNWAPIPATRIFIIENNNREPTWTIYDLRILENSRGKQ